jgi:hypothetical protein
MTRFAAFACTLLALGTAAPDSAGAPAASGTLERALATVSADHIRSDIFFLASDELEGRDTPSNGQRIAARYIRARLERLGFRPGAPEGFFYEYPLFLGRLDPAKTAASIVRGDSTLALELGRDYFLSSRRVTEGELDLEVVFGGAGKDADFDKREVAGAWVLVLDEGQSTSGVEKDAREKGAAGVIFTPGPKYDGKPYPERFGMDTNALTKGRVRWPTRAGRGEGDEGGEAGARSKDKEKEPELPMLWLSPEAAARLVPELADPKRKLPKSGAKLGASLQSERKYVGQAGTIQCENVCGFWPGSDPKLAAEVIIVSAHYDHVGYQGTTEIHNGADDNGSGTTGLLALAEALADHGPLRRSVMLMWVSGEEKGLFGSKAWTENPWLPNGAKAVCDINIDMIGRNAPDYLLITPTSKRKEYNGLVRLAEALASQEGFKPLGSADEYWHRSDQINFANNLQIPAVFLFSDVHEDYHKPGDDPEKIDCDKVRRVVRLVLRMLAGLQDDQLDL